MKLLDSRGRESITLQIVVASWLAITVMFMWKGSASDIASYGASVLLLLAGWLGREYQARNKPVDTSQ